MGRWWRILRGLCAILGIAGAAPAWAASQLSDQVIPLDNSLTNRPKPPIEIGASFFNTGKLTRPLELPTGAVWQPSLIFYGALHNALQTFDDGKHGRISEWATRLNLFGNLQLSGTERVLIGFRPFDRDGRDFMSAEFEPRTKVHRHLDGNVDRLFFEGDLSQIFPRLDFYDRHALDYGFAVGRQPIALQEGLLVDDIFDSIGVIRNTIIPTNLPPFRVTGFFGWNHIHRDDNRLDGSARLAAVDVSFDHHRWGTIDIDGVGVAADERRGSGLYGGAGVVNRFIAFHRSFNVAMRINGSYALDHETSAVSDGLLLFAQISRTPNGTFNFAYLNAYAGIDRFSSAARFPEFLGPLGQVGMLFSTSAAVGRYGSALDSRPADSVGAALGYQMFFDAFRRQVVLEVGGRSDTNGVDEKAVGVQGKVEQAVGQHVFLRLESFVAGHEGFGPGYGARSEVVLKF